VICAATALVYPRGWVASLGLVLVAIWLWIQARRDRGKPYVAASDGRLIVHAGRRALQQVDLRLLVGVRRGWNRTTLQLSDGTAVAIDHSWFASGAEAERFRKFVEEANDAREA